MASYTRGDFSGKRGTQVITDSLTFTGTGGVDVDSAPLKSGTTTIMNNTGMDNVALGSAVSEQRMSLHASKQIGATVTGSIIGQMWTPAAGALIGLDMYLSTACTVGHATVTVYIGATASTTFVYNVNTAAGDTRSDYTWKPGGDGSFAAGKRVSIQVNSDTVTTSTHHVGLHYKI